jgi:methionine-S-sulfoxide reductase
MCLLTAYFACGNFLGGQLFFSRFDGVVGTRIGYMGGSVERPTDREIARGETGHYETTEVMYNASVARYEDLVHFFFEIHDFTQEDGQGPDIGAQFRSAIFTSDDGERAVIAAAVRFLEADGYAVATKVLPRAALWPPGRERLEYYDSTDEAPTCHTWHRIF